MTLFVLATFTDYEGHEISGITDDRQLAMNWLHGPRCAEASSCNSHVVYEFELMAGTSRLISTLEDRKTR